MGIMRVENLAPAPLDAAAQFHADYLPQIRKLAAEGAGLTVLFPQSADHTHRSWRLAAVQELAREAAPARVNGVEGGSQSAIDEAAEYLANAHAITGQLMALDDISARNT